jgi:hypothetical protein
LTNVAAVLGESCHSVVLTEEENRTTKEEKRETQAS